MAYLDHLGFLFLGLLLLGRTKEYSAQSYKAVVVPYQQISAGLPAYLVKENTDEYVRTIKDLKNQADIVVFPENGITSLGPLTETIAHKMPYSVALQPGAKSTYNQYVLPNISSAAKSSEIYVVINVLEFDNTVKEEFYSTDVVFGPDGQQVVTCRKKYLYKERYYENGALSQDCTFEANFRRINQKVKFALLFDTDLLVDTPDKFTSVHDAILTSSLQNELPFPFGVSLQQGFSVKNRVNLLAAGYTYSSEGYGGSGIYLREGRSKVVLSSESLLQEDVPINQNPSHDITVIVTPPNKPDILEKVIYKNLSTSSNSSYCYLQTDPIHVAPPYRWVAFANTTYSLGHLEDIIVCALIKPEDQKDQTKILNSLRVVATVETNKIGQVLPLSLASGSKMVPANFTYKEEKHEDKTIITIIIPQPTDVTAFGILVKLKSGASVYALHMFVSFLPLLSILWSKFVM